MQQKAKPLIHEIVLRRTILPPLQSSDGFSSTFPTGWPTDMLIESDASVVTEPSSTVFPPKSWPDTQSPTCPKLDSDLTSTCGVHVTKLFYVEQFSDQLTLSHGTSHCGYKPEGRSRQNHHRHQSRRLARLAPSPNAAGRLRPAIQCLQWPWLRPRPRPPQPV